MLKKSVVCAALCLLTFSTSAAAADLRLPPPAPSAPRGFFFIGLGGSYNSIKSDQELYSAGVSNVFSGGTLVAFGQAGGPADPFSDTKSTFAPEAQAGFFSPLGNSTWLWGAKFRYKYLGITSTNSLVDAPQTGSFTNTGAAPANTSFTGNVIIQQSQMRVDHELVFLGFLGQSFGNTSVYLGAGPAFVWNEILHQSCYRLRRHQWRAHQHHRRALLLFRLQLGLGSRDAGRHDLLVGPDLVPGFQLYIRVFEAVHEQLFVALLQRY